MGPGFQSVLCKKAYLLWYLSDKFYLIALHGHETPTLHYCFVFGRGRLCYWEVDSYSDTSGSLKWMTGPQGNMGPVFEHFVVPTDVRGRPLRVAVTAPGQSTPNLPGLLEAREVTTVSLGTWYLWGAELPPFLAGFPCLAMILTWLTKKRIFWSCMISAALLVLVVSQGLAECAAAELRPRGWADKVGALALQEL